MNRLLLFLTILVATGCAHVPEYPLPDPPRFSTITGQRCGIKCREIDYECKTACRGTEGEQIACGSKCNQNLDQCYQHCVELFEE